ncbi:MAG: tetratricopeptide repeat protein [Bacteroidetes bacterium]|nr:tetratricopeptide repeat protein [Bacteroidota bacterium]
MKVLVSFYILCVFACFIANAQPSSGTTFKIDSVEKLLEEGKNACPGPCPDDSLTIKRLSRLCQLYRTKGNFIKAEYYGKEALKAALSYKWITPSFKKLLSNAYNNLGNVYFYQGNYTGALENYNASIKIREEINDQQGLATGYSNVGNICDLQGNYPLALKNHFSALKIREKIKDEEGIGASYNNIGIVYYNQANFEQALKNHLEALHIREKMGDKRGIAASLNNLALVYDAKGNNEQAINSHLASLKIKEELNDQNGIANTYSNIGTIYLEEKQYDEALAYEFKALKIQQEIGNNTNICILYYYIGDIFTELGKYKEARVYLSKALDLSKNLGSKSFLRDAYGGLSRLDSAQGNFRGAYNYYKLFSMYKDSLDNEETREKTIQNTMQYEFDKKEIATKAEQEKLNAITAKEKQKQTIIIYAVIAVLILVVVFLFFLSNRFRIIKRQKDIIENQKIMVDKAFNRLHEKNSEVMDSINYAKRIQDALLTTEKYIARNLKRLQNEK